MADHAAHVGFQSTSTIEPNSNCLAVSPQHSPLPAQDDNHDSDETTEINDSDNGPDDLSVDNSSRDGHSTPQLFIVDLSAMHTCAPTIVQTATVAVHSFYCLHAHMWERARPTVENQL